MEQNPQINQQRANHVKSKVESMSKLMPDKNNLGNLVYAKKIPNIYLFYSDIIYDSYLTREKGTCPFRM